MAESTIELEVILSIIVLILYIFAAHLIEVKQVDFLHESGIAILLGAMAGLIVYTTAGEAIEFSE